MLRHVFFCIRKPRPLLGRNEPGFALIVVGPDNILALDRIANINADVDHADFATKRRFHLVGQLDGRVAPECIYYETIATGTTEQTFE